MDERFVCRKTYTNGKDDEVKELIFCLTVIGDGGKYRVVNLTDNTLWENIFESESAAIDAIKNGSWNVIQEKDPRTEYSFHQWNKRRQMVTKIWLVYADKEPKGKSYRYDWSSERDGTRIVEVMNHDKTLSNEFSIVKITRDTEEQCIDELEGQLSDGIWENERRDPEVIEIQ